MSAVLERSRRAVPRAASVQQAASRAADLALTATQVVYLALLWLIASLPLVTAPAAAVALLDQLRAWRVRGDSPSGRGFLRRMRVDPVRRTLAMLAVIALHALALVDLYAIGRMGPQRPVVLVIWLAVALCAVLLTAFVPGLLARGVAGVTAARSSARLALARPQLAVLAVATVGLAMVLAPLLPLLIPLVVVAIAAVLERATSAAVDALGADLPHERNHHA